MHKHTVFTCSKTFDHLNTTYKNVFHLDIFCNISLYFIMFSVGKHFISLKALLTTVFITKQPKILKQLSCCKIK